MTSTSPPAPPAEQTATARRRFISRASLPHRLPLLLLWSAVLLYALYFAWLTLTRYAAFESRAFDMGNLNQAIWNTAHGNWFRQTNQPGAISRLALHVEPIILALAALYRAWPGPPFLLVLQAVIVALGAVPLYYLTMREVRSAWLALLLGAAWLAMPAIQAANWNEFHPVTLAPTFLIAAFYFLRTKRIGWYALFALLAALCKEEIGLLIFMLGLYALLAQKLTRVGVATMALGLGWSLVAVLGIQGHFGGNIHWGRYDYLGSGPAAMVATLITQPGVVWAQLQAANALGYLFQLLLPVGFVALLAPEVLLLALPSLALNLLADFTPMHQVDWLMYAAPIAPFIALAAVMGTARLMRWLRRDAMGDAARTAAPWVVAALVLFCATLAQILYGYFPGAPHFNLYAITDHHRAAAPIIAALDPAAVVSAQDKLNPHTSRRRTSLVFPTLTADDATQADTVFVDVTGPAWPQHPNDLRASITRLLDEGWGVAVADNGYLLLSATGGDSYSGSFAPSFYTPWLPGNVTPRNAQQATFGTDLRLLGYDVLDDAHGELITRFYWQTDAPITTPLTVSMRYMDEAGAPIFDSQFYPPVASLWYPVTQWPTDETVLVQSLPWALPQGRFALEVAVADSDNALLPVRTLSPLRPVVDGGWLRLGSFERTRRGWQAMPETTVAGAALDARFGDNIRLLQASIAPVARGATTATVALAWQIEAAPPLDYSLFIHLLNAAGEKVTQLDTQPRDGFGPLPMTTWPMNATIAGNYALPLPVNLPPGEYTVIVGLYDWQAGANLAATGSNVQPGHIVDIGRLRLP